jgi:hypothetical protein
MRTQIACVGLAVAITVLTAAQGTAATRNATSSPALHVLVQHSVASPGTEQRVIVQGPASVAAQLSVQFPDGKALHTHGKLDSAGRLTWTFRQPPNTLSRDSRTATVEVSADGAKQSAEYKIGYGAIDLDASPRQANSGDTLTLWTHTGSYAEVQIRVCRISNASCEQLRGRTGVHGWVKLLYVIPGAAPSEGLQLIALSTVHGHQVRTWDRVTVRSVPQYSLRVMNPQVQVLMGSTWATATTIHLGDAIRLYTQFVASEPAGNWFPPCVQGTVTVSKSGMAIYSAPLQCAPSSPTSMPFAYAATRLTNSAYVGGLDVRFSISYDQAPIPLSDSATIHVTLSASA